MPTLRQDFQYAARIFLKHPKFALLTVLSLSAAIAVNCSISGIIHTIYFPKLAAVRGMDQLVSVDRIDDTHSVISAVFSFPRFKQYQTCEAFSDVFASSIENPLVEMDGSTRRLPVCLVSQGYFEGLGVSAWRGRVFAPDEISAPGSAPVADHGPASRRRDRRAVKLDVSHVARAG